MEELLQMLEEMGLPFAYHHFAEGESPDPSFICYLLSGSNNFSADGKVYYKINEVHIELYTDWKDLVVEQGVEAVLDAKASVILKNRMHDMCAEGSAIFFSTHVLDVAEKLCNKVAIIKDGKLIAAGATEELTKGESLETVFMEGLTEKERVDTEVAHDGKTD